MPHLTTLTILHGARALVDRGWTQHADARDDADVDVGFADPRATCWCLSGAIDRVAEDLYAVQWRRYQPGDVWSSVQDAIDDAHRAIVTEIGVSASHRHGPEAAWRRRIAVVHWNDHFASSTRDVLDVLDDAIAAVSAR